MRSIIKSIAYESSADTIKVVPLADLHLGSASCDETLLKFIVKQIAADPMCYWVGLGDYAEYITRKDPRHKETRLAGWLHGIDDLATAQTEKVIEILSPIREKCLALLVGNHELTILKHSEVDVYARLCEAIRPDPKIAIAMGVQGFLVLRMRRSGNSWPVRFYLHHGYGGGRLEGGHALTLGRVFKDFDTDVVLMGHRHCKYVLPRIQIAVSRGGRIYERAQVGCFCGSFMRGYSDQTEVYSEVRGLPPLPVGPLMLTLIPAKKKIEVTV